MPLETMPTPGSSNIASVSYDSDVEDLTVEFVSGDTYIYRNVQPGTWRAFGLASSKGEFFVRQIKGRYSYEQV